MRRDRVSFSRRLRGWFYAIFGGVFLSGVLWLGFHYWLQVPGEFGPAAHPLEKWWLKLHGATAMASLVMLGILLPTHVRRAWAARRNRGNGLFLLAFCGVLVLTGYGLYYCGDEAWRTGASWLHRVGGGLFPLVLAGHIWVGRRSRRRALVANFVEQGRSLSKVDPPPV